MKIYPLKPLPADSQTLLTLPAWTRLAAALALGAALALTAGCSKNAATDKSADQAANLAPTDLQALGTQAKGFTVGSIMTRQAPVYVFFDPQCPHCGHLWQSAQPLLDKVKFVWVPIHMINRYSLSQGAALLTSANPAEAMSQHEAELLAGRGGMDASASIPSEVEDAIERNTKLFNQMKAESVPLIIAKDAQTGQPIRHEGAMETADLARLLGLPDGS